MASEASFVYILSPQKSKNCPFWRAFENWYVVKWDISGGFQRLWPTHNLRDLSNVLKIGRIEKAVLPFHLDYIQCILLRCSRLCSSTTKGMSHIIHMPSSPIYDLMFKPQRGKTAAKNSTTQKPSYRTRFSSSIKTTKMPSQIWFRSTKNESSRA